MINLKRKLRQCRYVTDDGPCHIMLDIRESGKGTLKYCKPHARDVCRSQDRLYYKRINKGKVLS